MAVAFPSFVPTWHNNSYDEIDPRKNSALSAKGKTVVISGGGRGIGARIAESFADAGADHIVLIGRSASHLQQRQETLKTYTNTKVHVCPADITDADAVTKVFQDMATKVGTIDILVANAAFMSTPATVQSSDLKDWWKSFEVNVLGGVNLIRAFLSHSSASPVLINVTACATHMSPIPGVGAYASAKTAFIKLLDYVAAENPNLRIMNMHPGILETDMLAKSEVTTMPKDDSKFISFCDLRVGFF